MGSGQSNVNLDAHLNKWETALSELEQLSRANRRTIEQDRIYNGFSSPSDARLGVNNASGDDDALERSFRGARRSWQVSFGTEAKVPLTMNTMNVPSDTARNVAVLCAAADPNTSCLGISGDASKVASSVGPHPKHNRQQVLETKKARMNFFKSYESKKPEETADVKSSYFGTTAIALSYLLGGERGCKDRKKRVTVEDIFFAAHVPLHYLHDDVHPLQMLKDIIREFVDVDNRFKNEYGLSVTHFDISPTIGQVELGGNEVGDRQRRVQLPEFSKFITHDCEEETQVVCIVNFDPYVLEQETIVDSFDDEEEINGALTTSFLGNLQLTKRHKMENDGSYGIIVDVRNVVQLMVTLAEAVQEEDGFAVRMMEVPAAALFKAMSNVKEGQRSCGYIRIFRKDCVPMMVNDEVPQMYTPELSSGKVIGSTLQGTHSSVISTHISPHIVAVAWAMHLIGGVRPNSHGYGNGLPVSDIIRRMRFPSEVFIDGALPLGEVFKYAREYVRISNHTYNVAVYPVLTRISREDAVPTISIFDLESIIIDVKNANEDPEVPEHVMVIMYNANVAHNVLNVTHFPQWCILAGYDQEIQMALLIDAHQKMFSQTWTCPLDRLHKAMTSYGYIIFSKSREIASRNKSSESSTCGGSQNMGSFVTDSALVGAPRRIASTVQNRLELLQEQQNLSVAVVDVVKSFRFPPLPLSSTMIALALCKIGINTTFEDVVFALPFEISALMLRYFTIEALAVTLTTYLRNSHIPSSVDVFHCEEKCTGEMRFSRDEFAAVITDCVTNNKKALIVLFHASIIDVFGASHPFGSTGLVVGYNAESGSVTVTDTNPNSYFRTWPVPIDTLYAAMRDTGMKHRRCGFIRLTCYTSAAEAPPAAFPSKYTRDFQLNVLPVQNAFHVSPSPHFQALSLAFAQLGYFYSPEELFYEAYLKTMDDQRRRGSQAFAWRDVDVSLSVINTQIDARFLVHVGRMFLESRNPRSGKLKLLRQESSGGETVQFELLDDVDVDDLDEILKNATRREGNNSVLLLNYDTKKAHDVCDWGRSVALVTGYNPDTKQVLLLDAEFSVFGAAWTVDIPTLIEIGDLNNESRSAYGFVKMERVREQAAKKPLQLMRGPDEDEDEPSGSSFGARRQRDCATMFVDV